jgi:hypothetical protein
MLESSRRSCLADVERNPEPQFPGPDEAARHHLLRANEIYEFVCGGFREGGPSPVQEAMATHYLREAALWVALAKVYPIDDETDLPPTAPELRPLVNSSSRVVLAVMQRAEAGEAMTPSFVHLHLTWHRRRAVAWLAAAPTPAVRLRAAQDHLDEVKALAKFLEHVGWPIDGPPVVRDAEVQYSLREAEWWVAQAQAEQDGRPRPDPAARRPLADAAWELWAALDARFQAGEAAPPGFIESLCQASRRVALTRRAAAPDAAARNEAVREHVDRMTKLHAAMDQRFNAGLDVSRVQVAQAMYFLCEAELWAAQAAKERP